MNFRVQTASLPGIAAFPGRVLAFSFLTWSELCSG